MRSCSSRGRVRRGGLAVVEAHLEQWVLDIFGNCVLRQLHGCL